MINTIFKKSEKQLLKYLSEILKENYNNSELKISPDYIYCQGNIPILLVAHLDTVHKKTPKEIFHDQKKNVLWSPQGIGADDRAGVLAILKLINHNKNKKPYVLFTTGEEIGGIGARKACKELNTPEVNLIIELDRKGKNDAVYYSCYNPEFEKYIEDFGFKINYGSYSDICDLCYQWKIAGVNLSIGYHNAHTLQEYLNLNEMNNTIKRVQKIINNLPEKQFEYKEKYSDIKYDYYDGYYYMNGVYWQEKEKDKDIDTGFYCEFCGLTDKETKIQYNKTDKKYYCEYCLDEFYFNCEECGETKRIEERYGDSLTCIDCFRESTFQVVNTIL